jgi:hypothetical protein
MVAPFVASSVYNWRNYGCTVYCFIGVVCCCLLLLSHCFHFVVVCFVEIIVAQEQLLLQHLFFSMLFKLLLHRFLFHCY